MACHVIFFTHHPSLIKIYPFLTLQDNWDDEEGEEEEKVTETKAGELKHVYFLSSPTFSLFVSSHMGFYFLAAVTKPSEKKKLGDKIKEKESLQEKKQEEFRKQVSKERHGGSCSLKTVFPVLHYSVFLLIAVIITHDAVVQIRNTMPVE